MAVYSALILNPRGKKSNRSPRKNPGGMSAPARSVAQYPRGKKAKKAKKAPKKKAPPRPAPKKKAKGPRRIPDDMKQALGASSKGSFGHGAAMAITKARQEMAEAAKKLEKKTLAQKKKAKQDMRRIEDLEKEVRSLRAKVGTARKRGDLTAAQETALKSKLTKCQKRLGACKQACESGPARAPKKAPKKAAKRKAKKAPKKAAKRKAKKAPKKAAKRKAKKTAKPRRPPRVPIGSTRVAPTVAASRKAAAKKTAECRPNPRYAEKPVKCEARPSASSLAACRRAYQSWQQSDKREAKTRKSARGTCGPGVPSKKAAGYLGGKQRPKKYRGKQQPQRKAPLSEARKIMATFMRLK